MTPAAVYLRVSKDDGTQTVENQRPEVMQMAAGRGYVVDPAHVYEDELSGAKGADERPALDAMLTAAARGKFRVVIVWRLDRLSRDDTFYGGALIVADLDRFNVGVLSHQQTWIDTTVGPLRNVFVQFAFALAADERKTLIDRTKRGQARARAAGVHIGRPKADASAPLLARAAEIRRERLWQDDAGRVWPLNSWRYIAARLANEKYANVPNYSTLRNLCTKAYPDLPRGEAGWRGVSRP